MFHMRRATPLKTTSKNLSLRKRYCNPFLAVRPKGRAGAGKMGFEFNVEYVVRRVREINKAPVKKQERRETRRDPRGGSLIAPARKNPSVHRDGVDRPGRARV